MAPHAEIATVVVDGVTPGECGGGAGACRELPFGFGGQAIRIVMTRLPVEPAHEALCVVPAHAHRGPVAAAAVPVVLDARSIGVGPERDVDGFTLAPVVAHAGLPLVPGDRLGGDG